MIAAEQLTIINREVKKFIVNEMLKDDLVDHLCCVIEDELKKGKPFDEAFNDAIQELAPDGLEEIQHETTRLLNPFKIIFMKKITYISGLITTIGMTMGVTLKILHMPGSEELFNFGFFGFISIFLPLVTIDRLRRNSKQQTLFERLRWAFGLLSMIVIASSMLFKIFHYDGSSLLWLIGLSIFSFGFLPFVFFDLYKKSIA